MKKLFNLTAVSFVIVTSLFCTMSLADNIEKTQDQLLKKADSEIKQNQKTKHNLMEKLNKIAFFKAKFSQVVVDELGNALQKGSGTLAISKPNLVHWATIEPDESLIVSDGETLWFYDPFIEQATAYQLKSTIENTPILLLTSDSPELWDNYTVSEIDQQTFLIHSVDVNNQVKTLELNFKDNKLAKISILDATGQLSHITLIDADFDNRPNDDLFNFKVPNGVSIDDQR